VEFGGSSGRLRVLSAIDRSRQECRGLLTVGRCLCVVHSGDFFT
jgi:hypothetical protein